MKAWLLLFILTLAMNLAGHADPVRVSGGEVRGQSVDGLTVYKGIPFAAPPVGARRWQPPQPPRRWKGVRDCLDFGPMCPQIAGPLSGTGPQSEDCLYLNIWAPADAHDLPVMVWFHGGGNMRGSDRFSYYDGTSLAHHGVIVVTAQYRVGIFGFLAHPDLTAESPHHSSGNYGLLDQIQALRWVQQNIAAFGGNPHVVTAFGESSGASDLACLMTSPLATGSFQRAILESGTADADLADRAKAETAGVSLVKALGLTTLKSLRQATAESLLHSSATFDAIQDGWVLPESPAQVWNQHRVAPVPVILGTNHDEGSALPDPPHGVADYQARLRSIFGTLYSDALILFPCPGDGQASSAMSRLITTLEYAAPARRQARALAVVDPQVYCYLFSKVPPGRVGEFLGAGHGTEVAYVFGSFRRPVPEHVALSNQMQEAWVRFAATGNPGGPDLEWPPYTPAADQVIEFGDTVSVRRGWLQAECDLADRVR